MQQLGGVVAAKGVWIQRDSILRDTHTEGAYTHTLKWTYI